MITQGIYDENTPCNPVGPYALSKYNAELRAIEIARESGMALTILRLATLYGEGDPGNVGRLMRTLDRGRFFWIGDGSNRKSLLYKGDAARACMAVVERSASGINIYNVSAAGCTMRDIVDGLAKALGKKPLPGRIPAPIAMSAGKVLSCFPDKRLSGLHATIEKWLAEDVYDTSRIESDYGFHAQVDFTEGLKREVKWYRQNQQTCQVAR
ncbi:MAG: NAD-dependent epimerase/dehydratase family protein [Pseudomonadota bacterium]